MRTLFALILFSAVGMSQNNPIVVTHTAHSWGTPPPPRLSTYYGAALGITDSGSTAGPGPQAIAPPANMKSGDLVVVGGVVRTTTTAISISNNGGQAWDSLTTQGTTNNSMRLLWCKFDGTWDANPSFVSGASTDAFSTWMLVFRPADTSAHAWALDVQGGTNYASPTADSLVTAAALTATADSTVVIAGFSSTDDNSWALQTGGWTQSPPAYTGLQNVAGSDNSINLVYKIQQAKGTTGTVVCKQTLRGPDAGSYATAVFK